MKLRGHTFLQAMSVLSSTLLCLAIRSQAAPSPTNATSKGSRAPAAPAASAAAPAVAEIPQSMFVVPTSAREGRDPFFPRTSRFLAVTGSPTPVKTNQPALVAELTLKGISGTRERPLAIINNQTFAVGEENEVVSGTRRVKIRCLEINVSGETVIVQFGTERRELRLKPLK